MIPQVLIVEDDVSIAFSIGRSLAQNGVDIIYAGDGMCGLAKAIVKKPDLIILDLMLPKMSGFLLLETLRKNHDIDCPVVVIKSIA